MVLMYKSRSESAGFTLPTVVAVSVIMFAILAVTLQMVAQSSASLRDQYYNQLAREATEAGVLHANECVRLNDYVAGWSASKPLKPNTDCSGNTSATQDAYILNNDTLRTSYSVGAATLGNGVQSVSIQGKVELIRKGTSTVSRTFTVGQSAVLGSAMSFSTVTFGYRSQEGAFFAVRGPKGQLMTTGYNGNGQLGNGTFTNSATPSVFKLPAGQLVNGAYTSFLSVGFTLFASTTAGNLYGAGLNDSGQLGAGFVSDNEPTPVKSVLPSGVNPIYVGTLRNSTYVIGSNNNVYSAGLCDYGMLGNNYAISGCSNRSTFGRVALPTVNASDLNTLPATGLSNLALDKYSVFLRMRGGRVYGWGENDGGQLGDGTRIDSSVPKKIGTFGDSGKPKAVQVAYDGETAYVLDSEGDVYVAGSNRAGSMGGAPAPLQSKSGLCLENGNNSTTSGQQLRIYTCNDSTAQKFTWHTDGTIRLNPNSSTELCVDNASSSTSDGNPIRTWSCNNSNAQKWTMDDTGRIVNVGSGKCLENPGNTSTLRTLVEQQTCKNVDAQKWSTRSSVTYVKIPVPASYGKIVKVATDNASVILMTADGQVLGAGLGDQGQLGNGSLKRINMTLQEFKLPTGRKAIDIQTSRHETNANTFVILDNGTVYGSGTNDFGQLGNGSTAATVSTPVKMNLPSGVVAASVQSGMGTAVVLTAGGKVYTVGNNSSGQLGDGTTVNSSTPQARQYVNVLPPIIF